MDLPEVKIEKDVPFIAGKKYSGITGHFYYLIEKMEVGESFALEARYGIAGSVHRAFKLHGWKAMLKTDGYAVGLDEAGRRKFKMRFWRTA